MREELCNVILVHIDVFTRIVIHKYIHWALGKYAFKINFDKLLSLKTHFFKCAIYMELFLTCVSTKQVYTYIFYYIIIILLFLREIVKIVIIDLSRPLMWTYLNQFSNEAVNIYFSAYWKPLLFYSLSLDINKTEIYFLIYGIIGENISKFLESVSLGWLQ